MNLPLVPCTNSPRTPTTSNGSGVDTIRLRGRVESQCFLDWSTRSHVDPCSGELTERPVSGWATTSDGSTLKLSFIHGQPWVSIERSVPTAIHGHNSSAVDVATVWRWLADNHNEATRFVAWADEPASMVVTRLDLVRDFQDVYRPALILDALHRLVVPNSSINKRFADPALGGAQSLVRGTPDRWRCTGYNKHAQLESLARKERDQDRAFALAREAARALGQLRVEVSARRPYLREQEINTMADVTDASTERIRRRLIERSQFLSPVRSTDQVVAAMQTMTDDPEDRGISLSVVGWLYGQALGVDHRLSETTSLRYKRAARKHGLTVADFTPVAHREGLRLDYDLGQLVPA